MTTAWSGRAARPPSSMATPTASSGAARRRRRGLPHVADEGRGQSLARAPPSSLLRGCAQCEGHSMCLPAVRVGAGFRIRVGATVRARPTKSANRGLAQGQGWTDGVTALSRSPPVPVRPLVLTRCRCIRTTGAAVLVWHMFEPSLSMSSVSNIGAVRTRITQRPPRARAQKQHCDLMRSLDLWGAVRRSSPL